MGALAVVALVSSTAFLAMELINDATDRGPTRDTLMAAFTEFAGDDLLLEHAEFTRLLASFCELTPKEVDQLFTNADKNRNGFVDDYEFDRKTEKFIMRIKQE